MTLIFSYEAEYRAYNIFDHNIFRIGNGYILKFGECRKMLLILFLKYIPMLSKIIAYNVNIKSYILLNHQINVQIQPKKEIKYLKMIKRNLIFNPNP